MEVIKSKKGYYYKIKAGKKIRISEKEYDKLKNKKGGDIRNTLYQYTGKDKTAYIIGAGPVGLFTAYKLLKSRKFKNVYIYEKRSKEEFNKRNQILYINMETIRTWNSIDFKIIKEFKKISCELIDTPLEFKTPHCFQPFSSIDDEISTLLKHDIEYAPGVRHFSVKINDLQNMFIKLILSDRLGVSRIIGDFTIFYNTSINDNTINTWLQTRPDLILNASGIIPKNIGETFGVSLNIGNNYSYAIILTSIPKLPNKNVRYNGKVHEEEWRDFDTINNRYNYSTNLGRRRREDNYKHRMFKSHKGEHYYSLLLNKEITTPKAEENSKRLIKNKYERKFNKICGENVECKIQDTKKIILYGCQADKICFQKSGYKTIFANIGDSFVQRHYHTGSSYNFGLRNANLFINAYYDLIVNSTEVTNRSFQNLYNIYYRIYKFYLQEILIDISPREYEGLTRSREGSRTRGRHLPAKSFLDSNDLADSRLIRPRSRVEPVEEVEPNLLSRFRGFLGL